MSTNKYKRKLNMLNMLFCNWIVVERHTCDWLCFSYKRTMLSSEIQKACENAERRTATEY